MAVYQTLTLTETSVDTLSNTSQVKVVWKSQQTGESHNDNKKSAKYWVSVNGVKTAYTVDYTLPAKTTKTILSKTFTVSHAEDGTGSVTVETWMDTAISAGEVEMKKTLTLTPIPRASTIGAADAFIESSAIVVVNRKSENYSHSIAFSFGALSGYLDADGKISNAEVIQTAANIPFTIPASFYAQIPDSPSGVCTLTCRTYYEGQQVGSDQTATFRVTANPSLCAPVVTGTAVDVNPDTIALTGSSDTLIRYYSTVRCAITAQARNGASMVSKSVNGIAAENTLEIPNVETGTFVFSATDSRGYTTAVTVNKTRIPYFGRTIKASIQRTDPTSGNAQLEVSGKFYPDSLGAADNTLRVTYELSTGDAVEVPVTVTGEDYQGSVLISGLDYNRSYYIDVIAADKLGEEIQTVTVKPGIPVFDWGKNDFVFHVPVVMNKNLSVASPMTVTDSRRPTYAVKKTADGEELGAIFYEATGENRRFAFRQYAADMDGAGTRYSEGFVLPVPSSGLTATKWYHILTSKNPVAVAQGGTGANIASEALSNLGGVSITTVWENASPSSSFASQTVSCTIPTGAVVEVIAAMSTSDSKRMVSAKCRIGESMQLNGCLKINNGREVYVTSSGVTFGTANQYSSYNGSATTANATLIPIRINIIQGVKENE